MIVNYAEHKKKHQELHKSLDELVADFINHNKWKMPSQTTLIELMEWSYKQTNNPDDLKDKQDG